MRRHGSHSVTDVTPQTSTVLTPKWHTTAEVGPAQEWGSRTMKDRYLSVDEVAELLGTTTRFPRRLIAERRIEFVKVGRHVRIPESAVRAFIDDNTVQPIRSRRSRPPYGRAA